MRPAVTEPPAQRLITFSYLSSELCFLRNNVIYILIFSDCEKCFFTVLAVAGYLPSSLTHSNSFYNLVVEIIVKTSPNQQKGQPWFLVPLSD